MLQSPGARSINFVFDQYVVPEGAQVFVYNANNEWLGAFTQASSGGRTEMGVTQLAGDEVTVEYIEPVAVQGQGRLHINQVTHAYRDVLGLMKGLGDSGTCNNNVICPEADDWRDEINSVAMITVGGSGICTGTLINNCANDGTPYFLTANHCTSGSNVGTWGFRFNWDSPTCTPTTNGPTNQTVAGASLLVNSAGSDVALLQLNTTPPAAYGVYYAGWDATGTAATSSTCIHHPSGDIKKISFDNNANTQGTFGGAACWRIATWEDGTTEPGSSGSGLWNQDHRLIGQLFGGAASCANNVDDYFGRFNVSYPLLDNWLGTCANVLNGYDPNGSPLGLDAVDPEHHGHRSELLRYRHDHPFAGVQEQRHHRPSPACCTATTWMAARPPTAPGPGTLPLEPLRPWPWGTSVYRMAPIRSMLPAHPRTVVRMRTWATTPATSHSWWPIPVTR